MSRRSPWQTALVVVVGAGLSLLGAWTFGYARGELEAQRAAAWQARTDTVRVEIARLDTIYQTDTLRLWRLIRQVDTLVRVDSIPVLAADSARADTALRLLTSSVRACVSTVDLCEQRFAAERRLRVLAESAAARPARNPRPRARAFLVGAALGAGTVLILRR